METLIYLYMWDSRWLWGLRQPDRPSRIWYVSAILSLAIGASYILKTDEKIRLTLAYSFIVSLLGASTLLLGYKQANIENRRLFAFRIDEHALRINHYFKRKEAIFSALGLFVLGVSLVKIVVVFLLISSLRNSEAKSDGHWPVEALIWLDIAALTIILLQVLSLAVVKGITQTCQAKCPLRLGQIKAYCNRSPASVAAARRNPNELLAELKKSQ